MYTITGVTGQVGGAVARTLLAAGKAVRAVVRDAAKGEAWAQQGCDIALAEVGNVEAMSAVFKGSAGVFIMMPSNFDPTVGFPEARRVAIGLREALAAANPAKVVCLSTIGAQATQPNLLNQLQILEEELSKLQMPITFLRPGWFMENCQWDVEAAKAGVIPSFLQPLDQAFPMIATADVGRTAAELLQEQWQGLRVVELVGSEYVSPNQIAATFSELLDKPVKMEVVARDTWHELFSAQGMNNPMPRIQMIDGFNQGWIKFAGEPRQGRVSLRTVLETLLARN
ncbi:NmrA family NAD(P)-binding protein [Pseudomonas sp. NA-150]|uniref:NmrA family NAD(P)-binding protein n=1 Tax=Pseudomonas sp. NA-150 TaxID=3367525 RepID=UPI0037CA0D23